MIDQGLQKDAGQPPASNLETTRFEFERNLEVDKLKLEKEKLKQARVDTWTRFAGTLLIGILVTGDIQCYSTINDRSARNQTQSTQQAQVAIQLASAREK